MSNLVNGIQSEMSRCRELVPLYEQIPNGAGVLGAHIIKQTISASEKAIADGDTIAMLKCYEVLRNTE